MYVHESMLVYVRGLIQKFMDTLDKHSNWIDSWMNDALHAHYYILNEYTVINLEICVGPSTQISWGHLAGGMGA